MDGFDMRVSGGEQLRKAAIELRQAGRKDLRRNMMQELRREGKPAVVAVKGAVVATPTKGTRGGGPKQRGGVGLRAAVAKATRLRIQTTRGRVQIIVDHKKLPPSQGMLPKYYDGEVNRFKVWRHPVFGNRENWVTQDNHRYFFTTIRRHIDDFQRGIERAIEKTLKDVARGR